MYELLNIIPLLLEQNAAEKRLTTIGSIFLMILFLILVIDAAIALRGGSLVPKNGAMRALIIIFFFIAMGILILINIYYK